MPQAIDAACTTAVHALWKHGETPLRRGGAGAYLRLYRPETRARTRAPGTHLWVRDRAGPGSTAVVAVGDQHGSERARRARRRARPGYRSPSNGSPAMPSLAGQSPNTPPRAWHAVAGPVRAPARARALARTLVALAIVGSAAVTAGTAAAVTTPGTTAPALANVPHYSLPLALQESLPPSRAFEFGINAAIGPNFKYYWTSAASPFITGTGSPKTAPSRSPMPATTPRSAGRTSAARSPRSAPRGPGQTITFSSVSARARARSAPARAPVPSRTASTRRTSPP